MFLTAATLLVKKTESKPLILTLQTFLEITIQKLTYWHLI